MSGFRRRIILGFFVVTYLYFLLGGVVSYQLANYVDFAYYDFNYGVSLTWPMIYGLLGLLFFAVGYFSVEMIRGPRRDAGRKRTEAPGGRHNMVPVIAVTIVFGIGVLGLLGMIGQYGGRIPAFAEHADEFRTNVASGLPQVLYFQLVVAALLSYALRHRAATRLSRMYLTGILIASLFFIYLGASRSMLLTPVLVIMVDLWLRGRMRWWQGALGLGAAGTGVFLIGLLRMDTQLEQGIYLLRLVADFAPEFREFAKLTTYMPERAAYLDGQMFINTVMIVVPGKLLDLVGASKSVYWVPFGEYLKNLFGYEFAGGGLRAGLIAEFYANFGPTGIIVGFLGLGGIVNVVDRIIRGVSHLTRPIIVLIGISLASSVLFTFDAVIYKIFSLCLGWILFLGADWCLRTAGQTTDITQCEHESRENAGQYAN